jgi:glutamine amidotransferase
LSIGIINIGIGNIGSVSNAVYSQGFDPILVSSAEDFEHITHLIIPGVGSYLAAMKLLRDGDLVEAIVGFVQQGKPTLGICLGMQLLSFIGFEGGQTEGLRLIEGEVMPLEKVKGLNLPHVGWNTVTHKREHPVLNGIKTGLDFYFVNGYFFKAKNDDDVIASSDYGQSFPSIIGNKNIIGVQFHPEKSQINGLRMLDNFCLWDGVC